MLISTCHVEICKLCTSKKDCNSLPFASCAFKTSPLTCNFFSDSNQNDAGLKVSFVFLLVHFVQQCTAVAFPLQHHHCCPRQQCTEDYRLHCQSPQHRTARGEDS